MPTADAPATAPREDQQASVHLDKEWDQLATRMMREASVLGQWMTLFQMAGIHQLQHPTYSMGLTQNSFADRFLRTVGKMMGSRATIFRLLRDVRRLLLNLGHEGIRKIWEPPSQTKNIYFTSSPNSRETKPRAWPRLPSRARAPELRAISRRPSWMRSNRQGCHRLPHLGPSLKMRLESRQPRKASRRFRSYPLPLSGR